MAVEPYEVDQRAVRFELSDSGMRVYSTTVKAIDRIGFREGEVTDAQGQVHVVDRQGEGATLVPLDAELNQELASRGEGFYVPEEGRYIEPPPIELQVTEPSLDQSLDGGRDGIG